MVRPIAYFALWFWICHCTLSAPLDHKILDKNAKDEDLRRLNEALGEANSQIDEMLHVVDNHEDPNHKAILEASFGKGHNLEQIKANVQSLKSSTVEVKTVRGQLSHPGAVAWVARPENQVEFDHKFYNERETAARRAGTVIHEASHALFNTHDNFRVYKANDGKGGEVTKIQSVSSAERQAIEAKNARMGGHDTFLQGYLHKDFDQLRETAPHVMHQNADSYKRFGELAKNRQPADGKSQPKKSEVHGHKGPVGDKIVSESYYTLRDPKRPDTIQEIPGPPGPPAPVSIAKPSVPAVNAKISQPRKSDDNAHKKTVAGESISETYYTLKDPKRPGTIEEIPGPPAPVSIVKPSIPAANAKISQPRKSDDHGRKKAVAGESISETYFTLTDPKRPNTIKEITGTNQDRAKPVAGPSRSKTAAPETPGKQGTESRLRNKQPPTTNLPKDVPDPKNRLVRGDSQSRVPVVSTSAQKGNSRGRSPVRQTKEGGRSRSRVPVVSTNTRKGNSRERSPDRSSSYSTSPRNSYVATSKSIPRAGEAPIKPNGRPSLRKKSSSISTVPKGVSKGGKPPKNEVNVGQFKSKSPAVAKSKPRPVKAPKVVQTPKAATSSSNIKPPKSPILAKKPAAKKPWRP